MIVPEITPLTRPYWEGARTSKLKIQSCSSCALLWHPPSPGCPDCGSPDFEWQDASGSGSVHSFVIVREAAHAAIEDRLPLVVALVRLAEGPLVITNIVGCEPEEVFVEMPLQLEFEPLTSEIALPQFRPR